APAPSAPPAPDGVRTARGNRGRSVVAGGAWELLAKIRRPWRGGREAAVTRAASRALARAPGPMAPLPPRAAPMPFRLGFRIAYRFAQSTPMVAMLDVANSEAHRLLSGPTAWTSPQVPLHRYRDRFGNTCTRLLAPAGLLVLRGEALVRDGSFRPAVAPAPEDLGPFLQPSRHCEVRPLLRHAQARFGDLPSDRVRVQAICAHVARSIEYVPETA